MVKNRLLAYHFKKHYLNLVINRIIKYYTESGDLEKALYYCNLGIDYYITNLNSNSYRDNFELRKNKILSTHSIKFNK